MINKEKFLKKMQFNSAKEIARFKDKILQLKLMSEVDEIRDKENLSYEDLAEKCGIKEKKLVQYFTCDKDIDMISFLKILRVLNRKLVIE